MNNKITFFIVFSLLAIYHTLWANSKITAHQSNHIRQVTYQPNQLIHITGRLFIATQIILGEKEKIIDVESGDASAWSIHVDKYLPNVLTIKPVVKNSLTNLIVVTQDSDDQYRYYHFQLNSQQQSDQLQPDLIYALKFNYINKQHKITHLAISKPQSPLHYNWDYSFSGSTRIMPLHVFDDGKFTYLQLRPHQPIPAVFAVDNKKGDEALVNYRQQNCFIIIPRLAPQFTLRHGKYLVTSIFNNKMIKKLRHK